MGVLVTFSEGTADHFYNSYRQQLIQHIFMHCQHSRNRMYLYICKYISGLLSSLP